MLWYNLDSDGERMLWTYHIFSYGFTVIEENIIRKMLPDKKSVLLSEELEISQRSVQRYIATLKAAGEWIEYDKILKGWKLTDRKSVLWGDW